MRENLCSKTSVGVAIITPVRDVICFSFHKLHIGKQWYALGRFLSVQGLIIIPTSNDCSRKYFR